MAGTWEEGVHLYVCGVCDVCVVYVWLVRVGGPGVLGTRTRTNSEVHRHHDAAARAPGLPSQVPSPSPGPRPGGRPAGPLFDSDSDL